MKKLTIREAIGGLLIAIGLTGIIASASALEVSALDMLFLFIPFTLIASIGVIIANSETAETEAPAANTMKRGNNPQL